MSTFFSPRFNMGATKGAYHDPLSKDKDYIDYFVISQN